MSEGPYTARQRYPGISYADTWVECDGKHLTTQQVADKLNAQHAQIMRLREALLGLKRGRDGCWCDVAIDNPMMGGKCSSECKAARAALEETK